MTSILKIDHLIDQKQVMLARVDQDSILIGREPKPYGVVVPSMSISGTHGKFLRYGHYWLYQDLGSTNGSWFNDNKIAVGSLHLIKNDDKIILSNSVLSLTISNPEDLSKTSSMQDNPVVLVFLDDLYLGDVPLLSNSTEFYLGGNNSYFKFREEFQLNNEFRIKRTNREVFFEVEKTNNTVFLNTQILNESKINLEDRDEIKIGNINLIFSYNYKFEETVDPSITTTGTYVVSGNLSLDSKLSNDSRLSSSFGKLDLEDESNKTTAIHNKYSNKKQSGLSIEDKVIIGIAVFLVFLVIVLLFWYVLS